MGSSTASSGSGPVIAITGTSGAGKGTLEQELMRRMPELELAVSATTRERRPSERDGREYHFVSEDEFERLVQEGAFLEHVTHVWGPRHGTLRSEIDRIRGEGRVPLLDLETQGALVVRDEVPGSVTVFVKAPTLAELLVVVVDLPSAFRRDDHQRVARVHVLEQLVNAGMDHAPECYLGRVTRRGPVPRARPAHARGRR